MLLWIDDRCKCDWSVKNKSVKGRSQIFSTVVSGNDDGKLLKKLWRFIRENFPFHYFAFTCSHRIKNCRNIREVDKLYGLAHANQLKISADFSSPWILAGVRPEIDFALDSTMCTCCMFLYFIP